MVWVLKMDKDGRVLLPEKLRAALHLQPGGKLCVHLEGERLTLVPDPKRATVRIQDGFPLIELPSDVLFAGDPVAEARVERGCEILKRLHVSK